MECFWRRIFDDTEAFAKMFQWTERNLAIRSDPLLAWRWLPDAVNAVPDRNNASDGDLFYAWALVRAAARFEDRAYMTRAKEIAQALAATCIVPMPGASGRTLLLPAQFGFNKETHVTINPSYYMPLAMREVAAVTGVSELAICAQHGEAFLDQLAQDGLVPDWVDVSADGITASEALSANTGYEAMRVPLFLTWSRSPRHLAVRRNGGGLCPHGATRCRCAHCARADLWQRARNICRCWVSGGCRSNHLHRRCWPRRAYPALHARSALLPGDIAFVCHDRRP